MADPQIDTTLHRIDGQVETILLLFDGNAFDEVRAAYEAKYPEVKCDSAYRTTCFYIDHEGNKLVIVKRRNLVDGAVLSMTTAASRAKDKAAEAKDLKDI